MNLETIIAGLQENSAALLAVYDQEDRLQYANKAFREAYSVAPGEKILWADIMRRNYLARRGTPIDDADFEAWLTATSSRRGKVAHRTFESDLKDGRWLWITETTQPDGWSIYVALDITSLRTGERELRVMQDRALRASLTDDLTAVSNRRHIKGLLEQFMDGRGGNWSRKVCVCMLDIDHFKQVNDRYGHEMGDVVLINFARTVQKNIRLSDGFGRVGGEEFMLIMPDIKLEEAVVVVDCVLDAVRFSPVESQDQQVHYTCSAGIAEVQEGDTPKSIYMRADAALYAAKREGRDRLKIAA
ncbi:GGDEF domain-containing protein [Labrys monachus]|uniref:diguanylate cyclase n=1 Tax=Labrys monachus TaxID=217067 RepID=A0ABU0F6W3_9HYPH|nr:sensor domain-containing diguanylate cyclase [Labrys monachus]MDQ0390357.1 diguanylate cyclase (GGDEF)-like protein [Labrys monachus]